MRLAVRATQPQSARPSGVGLVRAASQNDTMMMREKRLFGLNTIILPRQAWERHVERLRKRSVFCRSERHPNDDAGERREKGAGTGDGSHRAAGKKTHLQSFAMPFDTRNEHFTKTGSGQTQGSHPREREMMRFLTDAGFQGRCDAAERGEPGADAAQPHGAKNAIFVGVFPMFVPSLSWQNHRILYINGSKMASFAGGTLPVQVRGTQEREAAPR